MRVSINMSLAFSVCVAGCATVPAPTKTDLVSVTFVLDQLKDELYAFSQTAPTVVPKTGVCYDGPHPIPMNLVARHATTSLRTVVSTENSAALGVAFPTGSLAIAAGVAGSGSRKQTQTIVVPLAVETIPDKPDAKSRSDRRPQPIVPGRLSAALANFRDQILSVDHGKYPCLQYVAGTSTNFKLSLAFDVVDTGTAGIDLHLALVKISDQETVANEAHQTLDIELGLVPDNAHLLFAPTAIDPSQCSRQVPCELPKK